MGEKLKALDLYCCAGGASEGLARAGFAVTGIDIIDRSKNYPYEFIQADARETAKEILSQFDFIWASPPCQKYTKAAQARDDYEEREYEEHIEPIRELLNGHPYTCIENVESAPLRKDLLLTGPMFGLDRIIRRRIFELSFFCFQPEIPKNGDIKNRITITQSLSSPNHFYRRKEMGLPGRPPIKEACEAMDIHRRMTANEIGEAIPPPYAQYIANAALIAGCGNV